MYLRSIEMKGFKSFPERARLEFSPGVSVIVGPNGSGKSNITDAVLWALGEQSPGAIRGASMQDVISAGGKGVGQRRVAEVEVTIDNSEGRAATELSEIAVKRTLDRSGDGSYRLNGARCRLVDVVEVLSDTNLGREMHSVISQGRVESIVHSKPRERRLLIEEAAGLGKHRKRRRRAELKLRAARDNLDRALDLEREARARLRPLKRQAQAAELGARIEREELGLRGQLVAEELRFGADRAAAAEKAAVEARAQRTAIEKRLAEVSEKRRAAEERFAARDRERTQAWGVLTKLRGEQQRVAVRAAGLGDREGELHAGLEALRAELGPLTLDVGDGAAPGERARKLEEELGEIDAGLAGAAEGLARARSADASEAAREAALGAVRSGAERASRHARRAEGLLGERHREALRKRLAAGEELLDDVRAAAAAASRGGGGDPRPGRADRAARGRRRGRRRRDRRGDAGLLAARVRAAGRDDGGLRQADRGRGRGRAPRRPPRRGGQGAGLDRRAPRRGGRAGDAAPERRGAGRDRPAAGAAGAPPRPDRPGQPAGRARVRGGARARRVAAGPARGHRARDARAGGADPRHRPRDRARLRADLRGDGEELRGDGRAPLPRRPWPPAPGQPAPGPRCRGGGRGGRRGGRRRRGGEEEREELGVEIEVTPAGKSTRKLSLLSGGEKSLVAIAFVFAVFLARPCPFYILDEVEAALDDANIDRFLQLIRRFSDRAQFVIVTHQKRTMDAADVLYGVSMGGDGVTKVVSRRLPREVEEAEGDGAPR